MSQPPTPFKEQIEIIAKLRDYITTSNGGKNTNRK
jgi:hypothetical protein